MLRAGGSDRKESLNMKTKAVRIHGKMDLRLEEIELPKVCTDFVLFLIFSD